MDGKTIELVLANRQFLYGIAARAFAEEPDETFASVMQDSRTRDEVTLIDDEFSPLLAETYDRVVNHLRFENDNDGSLANSRHLYIQLFIGPGELLCAPWETMHISGQRTLFQPGVLEVRESYRQAGFLPERYPAVADDFIGLECDFLSKLAQSAYSAFLLHDNATVVQRLSQSQDFATTHFLKWIDSLAASIERHYGDNFYNGMAHFASLVAKRDVKIAKAVASDLSHS